MPCSQAAQAAACDDRISLLERGQGIGTIQTLMGYFDLNITMNYTHELMRGPMGVSSPAEHL